MSARNLKWLLTAYMSLQLTLGAFLVGVNALLARRHFLWIAIAGALILVAVWIACYTLPLIVAAPRKMALLQTYLIYDESLSQTPDQDISHTVWRRPSSRMELLLTRDFAVDPSQKQYPKVLQSGMARRPTVAIPPLKRLTDDELSDFVVDRGGSYANPESWEEIQKYTEQQKVERASAFFQSSATRAKPFFGDIPLRRCHREYETDSGVRTQLQIWKDFKLVNLHLKAGKSPEVFVVAAGGAYNAQVAACETERAPVAAYPHEQFWAVVFAGRGGSSPPKFILDRATVGRTATTIRIYQPPRGASTADIHEYWFFVPLGRLDEGEYSIEVRSANDDSLIASATSALRYASDKEVAAHNEEHSQKMAASNAHFKKLRRQEEEYGVSLQLRLERLAEFVASANVSPNDQELLESDVKQLGAAVDWNRDIYSARRSSRRTLAAPTPESPADIAYVNKVLDYPYTPWKKSDVRVNDVWLYAGPEASWYTSKAYRDHPEFDEATFAPKPSARQEKVRAILRHLADPSTNQDRPIHGMIVGGTIESAVDAAYEVYVNGKDRTLKFKPDDDLWAVMAGTERYFIRQIDTREYSDTRDSGPTREFRVHNSAYIGRADGEEDDEVSSATLALIPLGKQSGAQRVGVLYSCPTACCRQVGTKAATSGLVDVSAADLRLIHFGHGLCSGAYCEVESTNGDKK